MASKEFKIPIASETKAFEQGIRSGMIEPLEDAEQAITDLGTSKGPGKLEDAIEDAQDETVKLRKEIKRTAEDLEGAGRSGQAGLGKVQGASQELSQEVGQNLGQAVSSFRGDIEDLGQVGQDTLGGLAATMAGTGPAGLVGAAVVAAGAAGLGLITAEMQRQQEEADKLRDRLSGAYQEAAEAGRNYLDVAQIIAEANDIMFNPERAEEWKRIQEDANALGLDQQTLLQANVGDLDAQAVVLERISQLRKEIEDTDHAPGAWRAIAGQQEALHQIGEVEARYQGLNTVTEEYQAKAETAMQITSELLLDAAADAGDLIEKVDELGNRLWEFPDGTKILIRADTGLATRDLDDFRGDLDGIDMTVTTARVEAQTPDVDQLVRNLQRRLNNTQLRIPVRAVLPSGEPVL
ncbi:MAG TPA: hypothetical protein VNQ48_00195 [Microbacteriaceae bacterium]|nr:hypothetical protein [Microbacteriaceae bacterium]